MDSTASGGCRSSSHHEKEQSHNNVNVGAKKSCTLVVQVVFRRKIKHYKDETIQDEAV